MDKLCTESAISSVTPIVTAAVCSLRCVVTFSGEERYVFEAPPSLRRPDIRFARCTADDNFLGWLPAIDYEFSFSNEQLKDGAQMFSDLRSKLTATASSVLLLCICSIMFSLLAVIVFCWLLLFSKVFILSKLNRSCWDWGCEASYFSS